jgi:hypothetical protein
MKRYSLFLVSLMFIVLVFALAAGQARAEPKFPVSQLTMTICSRGIPEKMWFDEHKHTGHGRNMLQQWVMESSDLRFVGSGYDIVNWNLNLTTMNGVSWGDYELYNSNGVDGWIGKWQGKLSPITPPVYTADGMLIWLFEGRGEGHGFGRYKGLQEHFEVHQSVSVYPTVEEALDEALCVTGATLDGQVYVMQNDIPAYVTGHVGD